MNGGDIVTSIVLGSILYVIVTFLACGLLFGQSENEYGQKNDDAILEENKKNYLVVGLWPITLVFLLPVIVILLFKAVWWAVKATGLYFVGIKDLYKDLVAR